MLRRTGIKMVSKQEKYTEKENKSIYHEKNYKLGQE